MGQPGPFTAKRWHTYQLDADLFSAICASPCGYRMLYVSHAMMTSQGAHCMAILTKEDFPKRAATKLPAITCTPNRVENGRTKPRQTKRHTCPGGICPLLNSLGSSCGTGLLAPRRCYYQNFFDIRTLLDCPIRTTMRKSAQRCYRSMFPLARGDDSMGWMTVCTAVSPQARYCRHSADMKLHEGERLWLFASYHS